MLMRGYLKKILFLKIFNFVGKFGRDRMGISGLLW